MGMSEFYVGWNEEESLATLDLAQDRGITLYDTADVYGPYTNEELLGKWIGTSAGRRHQIVLATKFGNVRGPNGEFLGINGKAEYVKQACDASLRRLKVDTIDLYYLHRVDKNTEIEETMGAMAELVKAGKVRFLGLSEAKAETLERACKIHPIAALQSEYSLWTRDVEQLGILKKARELGTALVAYSPLGRGFLTGGWNATSEIPEGDRRLIMPRFQEGNFEKNRKLVAALEERARERGVATAQLALAWVLAQGEDVIPIPGTKRRSYLEQNCAAVDVKLTLDEAREIAELFPPEAVIGSRYPAPHMPSLNA